MRYEEMRKAVILEKYGIWARLFIVADVYDVITSDRPYRSLVDYDEVAKEIFSKSGSHFDPAVVETFLAIDRKAWLATAERYQDSEACPSTLI